MRSNTYIHIYLQSLKKFIIKVKQASKHFHIFMLCVSCSVVSDSVQLQGLYPPGSFAHGTLQARILEWLAIPFFKDLPDPGIEPRSPALQADLPLSEPPGCI